MKIIYYLNKNLEWIEIPSLKEDKSIAQTYPQTFTFGIDEALDAGEFSFYAPTNYHIPIDSIIKIDNDGVIKYWVVKDSKSSDMPQPNIWTQKREKLNTLTLTEPIEILRGFKVEPCAFAENSYTLEEIIKRLFDIANFDAEVEIPNITYLNPKLTYVSTTLYLAFFEIGNSIDYIPYLDFNELTKKWILKFKRRDGLNGKEYDISVFTNPKEFKTDFGEGLAKNVYSEIKNLIIEKIYEPNIGGIKPISLDETGEININNMGLKVDNTIKKIDSLIIYGFYFIEDEPQIDFNYPWILKNNNKTKYYIPITEGSSNIFTKYELKETPLIRFIREDDFQLLDYDEKNNINIIYIRYNNNYIYLSQLTKITNLDFAFIYTDIPQGQVINKNNVRGYILYSILNQYGFGNAYYQIQYSPIISNSIPVMFFNDSKYDDTTYFNQTSQQVDPNRIGRVLQTYIDNMSNGSVMKSGVFYSWTDIPMAGSIVKDGNKRYLVDSITISQTSKFSNVDAQLCLERARRRVSMEASTDLQLNTIPNENLIDKLSIKVYKIKFSIKDNNLANENLIFNIKDFLNLNGEISQYSFYNRFTLENNDDISEKNRFILIGKTSVTKLNTNILYREKADSNFIWTEVIKNLNMIPYYYTNSQGKFYTCGIILKKPDNSDFLNYPYYRKPIYDNQLSMRTTIYNKDPYEIFNFTFQVNYRGTNNTIVREEYVEYLLNGVQNPIYSIRLYNINIGRYDNLPSEYVAEITPVSVSEFDETNNYISVDFTSIESNYKSIVLLLNNKPIMIKNYFEEQVRLEPFKIYVAAEDGTPLRTGVVGIDPTEESN